MKMTKWLAPAAIILLVFFFSCGDDDDDNDDVTISPAVGPWSFTFTGTSSGEGRFDLSEGGIEVSGNAAGVTDQGGAFEMAMDGTLEDDELNLLLDGVLAGGERFEGGFWGTLGQSSGAGQWQIATETGGAGHGEWQAQYTQ